MFMRYTCFLFYEIPVFFFWSISLLNLLLSSFYLQEFFCTYFLILFCLLVENILFQFVVSFYFLYVYFDEQRFLILMWLNLAVSSFIIITFCALLEKFFPILRSQFSPKLFILWIFLFMS